MGKTAVFVLAILNQLKNNPDTCSALILCHTRELAYQINKEFNRLGRYLTDVKTAVFYGGDRLEDHKKRLETNAPQIIVGTPGRVLDLVKRGYLKLDKLKFFVLDECDKMLDQLGTTLQLRLFRYERRCAKHFLQNST